MKRTVRLFFDQQVIGSVLVFAGSIILISFVMTGLYPDLVIVEGIAGFRGSAVAFALSPLTLVVVPWYGLLAYVSWLPMVICYGGMTGGALVLAAGMFIKARGCVAVTVLSPAGRSHYVSDRTGRKSMEGSI